MYCTNVRIVLCHKRFLFHVEYIYDIVETAEEGILSSSILSGFSFVFLEIRNEIRNCVAIFYRTGMVRTTLGVRYELTA